MIRRLCARLSFVLLVAPLALLATTNGAAASGAGGCDGDHVVVLDQRVDSRVGSPLPHSISATFPSVIPAGTYELTVVTFDGYEGRSASDQPNEQVVLHLGSATFGPTPDLPDGDEHATATAGGEIELAGDVDTLVVTHRLTDTDDNNSVGVACVALTEVTPPPPPPPPPTVDVLAFALPTCVPGPGVSVQFANNGAPVTVAVTVDGATTSVDVAGFGPDDAFIPVDTGERPVTVAVGDVVILDTSVVVDCEIPDTDEGLDGDLGDSTGDGSGGDGTDGGSTGTGDGSSGGGSTGTDGGTSGDGTEGGGSSGDGLTGQTPSPSNQPAAVLAPLGFIPELALRVECSTGAIEAVVDNVGDTDGGITLAVAPSASAVGADVSAASTTTVALPLPTDAEGSVTQVVLVTDDGTVITDEIEIDCLGPADPVAEVVVDCASGSVTVRVENAGEEMVTVRAFAEQVALLGSDELVGGAAVVYDVEISGATVPLRIVSDDGGDILRDEIEHGCTQTDIDPGLSLVCPSGEVQLRLVNTSDAERVAIVTTGDDAERVTLAGGTETVLVRALASTPAMQVTSIYGDVLLEQSLEDWECVDAAGDADCVVAQRVADQWVVADDGAVVPCSGFQSRLVLDCASEIGLVEIANGTDRPALVVVDADGEPVGELDVAVQETGRVSVEDAAGARITAATDTERLLDTIADCQGEPDRTAAVLSGLLVALMSIVAVVVARFDPWIRV